MIKASFEKVIRVDSKNVEARIGAGKAYIVEDIDVYINSRQNSFAVLPEEMVYE